MSDTRDAHCVASGHRRIVTAEQSHELLYKVKNQTLADDNKEVIVAIHSVRSIKHAISRQYLYMFYTFSDMLALPAVLIKSVFLLSDTLATRALNGRSVLNAGSVDVINYQVDDHVEDPALT